MAGVPMTSLYSLLALVSLAGSYVATWWHAWDVAVVSLVLACVFTSRRKVIR